MLLSVCAFILLLKVREQKTIALLAILEDAIQVPDTYLWYYTEVKSHRVFET